MHPWLLLYNKFRKFYSCKVYIQLFFPNQDLSRSLENEKKSSEAVLLRLFPSLSGKSDLEVEAQEALEAMAKGEAHYKNVLAQTDSMLTSLQASVETAEAEWRLKLEVANKWVRILDF